MEEKEICELSETEESEINEAVFIEYDVDAGILRYKLANGKIKQIFITPYCFYEYVVYTLKPKTTIRECYSQTLMDCRL